MLVEKLTLGGASRAAHVGFFPLRKPERLSEAVRGFQTKGLAWEEHLRDCRPGTRAVPGWPEMDSGSPRWRGCPCQRMTACSLNPPSPEPAHAHQEGERAMER